MEKEKEVYLNRVLALIDEGWSIVFSKRKAMKELGVSNYCSIQFQKESPEFLKKIDIAKRIKSNAKRYRHDRREYLCS